MDPKDSVIKVEENFQETKFRKISSIQMETKQMGEKIQKLKIVNLRLRAIALFALAISLIVASGSLIWMVMLKERQNQIQMQQNLIHASHHLQAENEQPSMASSNDGILMKEINKLKKENELLKSEIIAKNVTFEKLKEINIKHLEKNEKLMEEIGKLKHRKLEVPKTFEEEMVRITQEVDASQICEANQTIDQCDGHCEANCDDPPEGKPPVCVCAKGYARNQYGQCVLKADCPKCPVNEVFHACSSFCERKCGQTREIACIAMCDGPKCECKNGFIRNTASGQCVRPTEC